jgi:CspA family cold shock protein
MSEVEREGQESQIERERSLELQRSGERQTGIVREFDEVTGYGFITPDDGGRDAFVHFAAVLVTGRRTLSAGQRVSYRVKEDAEGRPEAMAVIPEGED